MHKKLPAWIYLTFSVAGAILPTLSNIEFIKSYGPGFDLIQFFYLANANPAAESLARDLFVGAGAVMFWIAIEGRRLGIKYLWVVFLVTFSISFACAAPLFLFLRERKLAELEEDESSSEEVIL